MKFSEYWLREWVNLTIDSNTLVNQFTMFGLEVDAVESVAGYFTNVVVGKVVNCYKHPNIETLNITKIDVGGKQLLDIVCSAHNCRENLKVVVATIGAQLQSNSKIQAIKLHGILSEGMLCSFSELSMPNRNDGIIELPYDAPIGLDIRDYLQLDDNIISINVTSNRADCLCLLGIARDVAVYNRLPLKIPVIEMVTPVINDKLSIHIIAKNACPCYLSRVVQYININAVTPLWMTEKLIRCGLRLEDTVTNITNYVLLELGQPINAFDREKIAGEIIIRYAKHGELLTLINGTNITLMSDTLVIADHKKVLAIAGIINGVASSINQNTRSIVLECAFYFPYVIRGQAQYYGLNTETSYRYERGVDPASQQRAMERITALLLNICGGYPGPITITNTAVKWHPTIINLHRTKLDRLMGYVIPEENVSDILISLGYLVSLIVVGWKVVVPSWRFDMSIEEDLISEIIRIYGYHKIPNIPVCAILLPVRYCQTMLSIARVKTLLVDRGYQEVITYSFVNPKNQALLHPRQTPLILSNPISQDMSSMRLSLWTGLLNTVVYNQNHQQQRICLFESGLCFIPGNTVDQEIHQDLMLAGVITGHRFSEHWDQPREQVDFYDIKGDVEAILELTGKLNDIEFRVYHHPALHPGKCAAIYLYNEVIGFVGVIHPELELKLNLNSCTMVFELLWDKITINKIPKINIISRFPANRRDIAVIVADNVSAADIISECKKVNTNQLVSVNLFDVYQGSCIAKGFKSLAISLIVQDTTHTMEEEEIAATVTKCVAALKQRFQASLRD